MSRATRLAVIVLLAPASWAAAADNALSEQE
jgi:hypothetical protein